MRKGLETHATKLSDYMSQFMVQITDWGRKTDKIKTVSGTITYEEWCKRLVDQIDGSRYGRLLRVAEVRENGSGRIAVFANNVADYHNLTRDDRIRAENFADIVNLLRGRKPIPICENGTARFEIDIGMRGKVVVLVNNDDLATIRKIASKK
jgi:hypothetical protein